MAVISGESGAGLPVYVCDIKGADDSTTAITSIDSRDQSTPDLQGLQSVAVRPFRAHRKDFPIKLENCIRPPGKRVGSVTGEVSRQSRQNSIPRRIRLPRYFRAV